MRSTFKYLFYINRNKIKKNGLCPVMVYLMRKTGSHAEPEAPAAAAAVAKQEIGRAHV